MPKAKNSYPLRLPEHLDAAARERCESLGISLNALIAVALDDYLGKTGRKRPAVPGAGKQPKQPAQPFAPQPRNPTKYHPDPDNWRNFHNPEQWPLMDDDWDSGLEEPDSDDCDSPEWKAYFAEVERLYWQTHERPAA